MGMNPGEILSDVSGPSRDFVTSPRLIPESGIRSASLACVIHHSSADSMLLPVISDADQGYPVIVKNIVFRRKACADFLGKEGAYSFTNCCAAHAPSLAPH